MSKMPTFHILLLLIILPTSLPSAYSHGASSVESPPQHLPSISPDWKPARATYYAASDPRDSVGGACGYGDLVKAGYGQATVGLSQSLFQRGQICGACFQLRCVDDLQWCIPGTSIILTVTNFCAPNYGFPLEGGGHCNPPNDHFVLPIEAFEKIAIWKAGNMPVQYRRIKCRKEGGIRYTVSGSSIFISVLITNVAGAGDISAVKIKGSRTGWLPMGRNWGQNWHINADLRNQPLSFEVNSSDGQTVTAYNVAPKDWNFGQTFEVSNQKCKACEKTVYLVDKLVADTRIYHKSCFRCHHCNNTLKLSNFCSFEGVLYCRPHFNQLFKRTGSLDKSFEGTPKVSKPEKPIDTENANKMSNLFAGTKEKCKECTKTVYPTERVTVNGTWYHRKCFKCSHGGCTISPSNYIAHEGKLYCKHHHIQLFKEKGNYSQLENDNHDDECGRLPIAPSAVIAA